jgi:hypothetical protein
MAKTLMNLEENSRVELIIERNETETEKNIRTARTGSSGSKDG